MKKGSESLLAGLSAAILEKRKKMRQPDFMPPMLATLTEDYFSSPEWVYEHKFDGVRCLAFKKKGKVRLLSRNNKSMNVEYPEVVDALLKQAADNFIVDGEIISIGKSGVSDFQLLQGRMHVSSHEKITVLQKQVRIKYCVFDLMYVDSYDIRPLPLLARKKILKKLLTFNSTLAFSVHKSGDGICLL